MRTVKSNRAQRHQRRRECQIEERKCFWFSMQSRMLRDPALKKSARETLALALRHAEKVLGGSRLQVSEG